MLTVADVLAPEFSRTWHEAVAIVQEVASQLGPDVAVPTAADLVFTEEGGLSFGFGNEDGQAPVAQLAGLLQTLLNGIDAPQGLRDLATENAGAAPSHSTVQGFARALEFYERPGRSNDIAAVAGRLKTKRDLLNAEREFERLREKVSGEEVEKAEEKPKPAEKKAKPEENANAARKRRLAMAVSGALFLVILVAASAAGRARAGSAGASATDAIRSAFRSILSSGPAKAEESAEAAPAAGVPAEAPDAAAPGKAAPTTGVVKNGPAPANARGTAVAADRSTSAPAVPAQVPAADATIAVDEPTPSPSSDPIVIAAVPGGATALVPEPLAGDPNAIAGVYSAADTEVQAPRMLRPALPKEPEPDSLTGYFDLVIDEAGNVERVTLISPTRQYREWMLLAAAKAWKFAPAKRDGRPVKYKLRVPIILPGWQAAPEPR